MRDALKNLTLAVLTILMLLGIGWIVIRNRGLSKPPPQPFPHAILETMKTAKPLAAAYRGDSAHFPPNTMLALEKAAALDPNLILWIDVRPTKDGTFVMWTDKDLSSDTDGKGWVGYEPLEAIQKLDAAFKYSLDGRKTFPFRGKGLKVSTLKEVLEAFPKRLFIINIQDYKEGGREILSKLFEETKAGERALVASPEDGVLRDLREDHPTWIFGTSRPQVTRLLMLSDLYIGESTPMKGDVFVWDATAPLSKLSERAWTEVQRRQMKSVVVIHSADEIALWKTRADALVSSDPESLLKSLK